VLDWFKAFFRVAFAIRFSIAMSLLAGLAVSLPPQALEALRVMASKEDWQFWPRVLFAVVDGGYFENSGTATVLDLVSALDFEQAAAAAGFDFQVIVIRIGTDVPADLRYDSHGLGEITSPVYAVVNAGTARGTLAVQEMEAELAQLNNDSRKARDRAAKQPAAATTGGQTPPAAPPALSFCEAHFEIRQEGVQLPLGYLLSKEARENMNEQMDKSRPCDGQQASAWPCPDSNNCSFRRVIEFLKLK